jgi:hypothetical protein
MQAYSERHSHSEFTQIRLRPSPKLVSFLHCCRHPKRFDVLTSTVSSQYENLLEIPIMMTMKINLFWDVMPISLIFIPSSRGRRIGQKIWSWNPTSGTKISRPNSGVTIERRGFWIGHWIYSTLTTLSYTSQWRSRKFSITVYNSSLHTHWVLSVCCPIPFLWHRLTTADVSLPAFTN